MTDNETIYKHLHYIANEMPVSAFCAALRDARKFTGRNLDTGGKLSEPSCGDHGSWLGAIGYMTLIDQIGSCFKPKG